MTRSDDALHSESAVNGAIENRRGVRFLDGLNLKGTADPSILDLTPFSVMCAPLIRDDRVFGALYVDRHADGGDFSNSDLQSLQDLAERAAGDVARWLDSR